MNNFEKYLKDYGPEQVELPINKLTEINNYFRLSLWTGNHVQVTLMNIKPNEDVGLERHDVIDQLLFIVKGSADVYSGNTKETIKFKCKVDGGDMVAVPAGTWHNLVNTTNRPLKLYSIYAPVEHEFNTKELDKPSD